MAGARPGCRCVFSGRGRLSPAAGVGQDAWVLWLPCLPAGLGKPREEGLLGSSTPGCGKELAAGLLLLEQSDGC